MKTIAVAAGIMVVVILVGIGVSAMRRRRADDVHSVEGYRSTLNTLEGLGARPITHRPVREAPSPSAAGERRRLGGTSTPAERAAARGPLAVDDVGRGRPLAPLTPRSSQVPAGGRRPVRYGLPLAVGVVVAAIVAAGVIVLLRHHHPPASAAGHRHTSTSHPTTTTTTVPARYTAAATTPGAATYDVATSTYTVALSATTGPCWVDVRSTSGSTVFTGTLASGTTKTVPLTGGASIAVGAPSALAMTIDHVPVVMPTSLQAPFTITLAPPTTSSG